MDVIYLIVILVVAQVSGAVIGYIQSEKRRREAKSDRVDYDIKDICDIEDISEHLTVVNDLTEEEMMEYFFVKERTC